ncbi:MAG: hypothetical protein C0417_00095 [Chlorobiaceae bacterium]|nr:hypothetical protein [Chlorobiaceae bacterium]
MILEYFRPATLSEAVELLQRNEPITIPLGGGLTLAKRSDDIAVVDLQSIGLNYIKIIETLTVIGATTTLEEMIVFYQDNRSVVEAIKIQCSKNQRVMGTIAGLIVSENGRSPLLTVMLALNAQIVWLPGEICISLEDWLPKRHDWKKAALISEIKVDNDVQVVFESVGRSPYDQPTICCAVAKWKTGRTRITFGGFGDNPVTAFDGDVNGDLITMIKNVLADSSDQWASSVYRQDAGTNLAMRLLKELK